MQRAWYKEGEKYNDDVRKDRTRKECCLQFYGAFQYDHKGPCHVYYHETGQEKQAAEVALQKENEAMKAQSNRAQHLAQSALSEIQDHKINACYNTRTRGKQHIKKHNYTRGKRKHGGVDGYCHREGALKKVVPWIHDLKSKGIKCTVLQDGAPAHKSRISRDYLTVEKVDWLWLPGHSPDVNASEHAWPWIWRHITRYFTPSRTEHQCEQQWVAEWEAMPIEVINKWIMGRLANGLGIPGLRLGLG
jgi:transposase